MSAFQPGLVHTPVTPFTGDHRIDFDRLGQVIDFHRRHGADALARDAERAGAAAVVATTPYYWTPPPAMLLEHFSAIGSAVTIPLLIYNSPDEMAGTKLTSDLALKLIERLPNFAGIVDLSLDWQ